MNKGKWILVFLIAILLSIGVAMVERSFRTYGAGPRLHKKDIPGQGLRIVNSDDATFQEWIRLESPGFVHSMKELEPFSVFVSNANERSVIAYTLNWEVKMFDGTVVNYPREYFSPTYLMGVERSDYFDTLMRSIKKNSPRLFTIIPSPLETQSISNGGAGQIRLRGQNPQAFEGIPKSANEMDPILDLKSQLSQATDITVSIESALFDDGAFVGVGPSGNDQFNKISAYVQSKYDLLRSMMEAQERGTSVTDIFDNVILSGHKVDRVPAPYSDISMYYEYFRQIHVQEVASARKAVNDDSRAMAICLDRLKGRWVIPRNESSTP